MQRKKRVVSTIAAGAVLVGLSGCTITVDRDASGKQGSVAVQATPAAAGAVMSLAEARETYLKLVAPSNTARDAWMKAGGPTAATLAAHKKLATRAADATAALSKGLRTHRWPTGAQSAVDELAKALDEREAAYRAVAKAKTVSAYLEAAYQVPVTTSVSAYVRDALGLPPGAAVEGATPRN